MSSRFERAARYPLFTLYRELFARALKDGNLLAPGIAVYTGSGASHSWIWFADLFERLCLYDISFLSETDIFSGALNGKDAFFIGGGDTLEMACALGGKGARLISNFVANGGFYYGSCAGAYLVLSGVDDGPFKPFNLFPGNMLNVMKNPPPPRCLQHKYTAPYGDRYVFHPVYGEVVIKKREAGKVPLIFQISNGIEAPLFGGPVIDSYVEDHVIALYGIKRTRAAFLWEFQEAARFLEGKPAVCAAPCGSGLVFVSGPHLEHPLYPAASCVIAEALFAHLNVYRSGCFLDDVQFPEIEFFSGWKYSESVFEVAKNLHPWAQQPSTSSRENNLKNVIYSLKRVLSNARIVAYGLEKMPVAWKIGLKVWEPEKIRMLLETAWVRVSSMSRRLIWDSYTERLENITEMYSRITSELKNLLFLIEKGADSDLEVRALIGELKKVTVAFLSLYFEVLKNSFQCGLPLNG